MATNMIFTEVYSQESFHGALKHYLSEAQKSSQTFDNLASNETCSKFSHDQNPSAHLQYSKD